MNALDIDYLLEASGINRRSFLKRLGVAAAGAAVAPALSALPTAPKSYYPFPPLRPFSGKYAMYDMYDPKVMVWQAAYDKAHHNFYRHRLPHLKGNALYGVKGAPEAMAEIRAQDEALKHTIMNPTPEWEMWMRDNIPNMDVLHQKGQAQAESHRMARERDKIAGDQPAAQPGAQSKAVVKTKAKRVWPERAQRQSDEEEHFDEVPESMKAKAIVDKMLDENYDEHVKAHQLVQKWDNAHKSYGDLYKLKHKSMGLFREMGTAIAYERALARVGLKRADVERPVRGAAIGSTHNYKVKMPVVVCSDQYCSWRGKPQPKGTEVCGSCGNPVTPSMVPTPPSVLRGKLSNYIVGVETKDGRRVWFDEPIPPQPELESEEPKKPSVPIPASEFGAQGRLGKWWK